MARIRFIIKIFSVDDISQTSDNGFKLTKESFLSAESTGLGDCVLFRETAKLIFGEAFRPKDDEDSLQNSVFLMNFSDAFGENGTSSKQKKAEAIIDRGIISAHIGDGYADFVILGASETMYAEQSLLFMRKDLFEKEEVKFASKNSSIHKTFSDLLCQGVKVSLEDVFSAHKIIIVDNPISVCKNAETVSFDFSDGSLRTTREISDKTLLRFDGVGIISMSLAEHLKNEAELDSYCFKMTLPFVSGLLVGVDFVKYFASAGVERIRDAFGTEHRLSTVDMILTKSMFDKELQEAFSSSSQYCSHLLKFADTVFLSIPTLDTTGKINTSCRILNSADKNILQSTLLASAAEEYEKLKNADISTAEKVLTNSTEITEEAKYKYKKLLKILKKHPSLLGEAPFKDMFSKITQLAEKRYASGKFQLNGAQFILCDDVLALLSSLIPYSTKRTTEQNIFYSNAFSARLGSKQCYIPFCNTDGVIFSDDSITPRSVLKMKAKNSQLRDEYLGHLKNTVFIDSSSGNFEKLGHRDTVNVIFDESLCSAVLGADDTLKLYNCNGFAVTDFKTMLRCPFEHLRKIGDVVTSAGNISKSEMIEFVLRHMRETLTVPDGFDYAKIMSPYYRSTLYPRFLKLLDSEYHRHSWYEESFNKKYKKFSETCRESDLRSAGESLCAFVISLREKFAMFPALENSRSYFTAPTESDKAKLESIKNIFADYEKANVRIFSHLTRSADRSRLNDIKRILFSRGQEELYDTESLYSCFADVPKGKIFALRDGIIEKKWHFMSEQSREAFLCSYLPDDILSEYKSLFCDFRLGGYRVLGNLILDVAENHERCDNLMRSTDSDGVKAFISAYLENSDKNAKSVLLGTLKQLLTEKLGIDESICYSAAHTNQSLVWEMFEDEIFSKLDESEA